MSAEDPLEIEAQRKLFRSYAVLLLVLSGLLLFANLNQSTGKTQSSLVITLLGFGASLVQSLRLKRKAAAGREQKNG